MNVSASTDAETARMSDGQVVVVGDRWRGVSEGRLDGRQHSANSPSNNRLTRRTTIAVSFRN